MAHQQPVATLVSGSLASSLASVFAREWFRKERVPQEIHNFCQFLPDTEWHLDPFSLLIGLIIGILFLPFLDLVVILRVAASRRLQLTLGISSRRPLYRILE